MIFSHNLNTKDLVIEDNNIFINIENSTYKGYLVKEYLDVKVIAIEDRTLILISDGIDSFDLSNSRLLKLMEKIQRCSEALKKVIYAESIEYKIVGQDMKKLYVYLFPVYDGKIDNYNKYKIKHSAGYDRNNFNRFFNLITNELM